MNCIHTLILGVWSLTELKVHRFLELKNRKAILFAKAMDGLEAKKAAQTFLSTHTKCLPQGT